MDNLSNKISFLKGYCEGLELPTESKEGKVISLMLNILCDVNVKLEELEDTQVDMIELVESLGNETEDIANLLTNKQCNCSCNHNKDESLLNSELLELDCPHCNHNFGISEDMLYSEGDVHCPNCNEIVLSDELDELVTSLYENINSSEEIEQTENNAN